MTDQLASDFWQGLEQFNRGEYYACHDTLEAIWMEATDPPKSLYQGILQVAVGIYHLSNQNWKGSVILLGEGINRIRRYDSDYAGVDIDDLLEQSSDLLMALQTAGPEQAVACAHYLGLLPEDSVAEMTQVVADDLAETKPGAAKPEVTTQLSATLDEDLKARLKLPKIRYQQPD